MNNVDLDPTTYGGEFPPTYKVYVVVMNEQGTLGHYAVTVEPAPVTNTGPGANAGNAQDIPFTPNSGTVQHTGATETVNGSSYSVHTPVDMLSGSAVTLNVNTLGTSGGQAIHVNVSSGFALIGSFNGTVNSSGFVNIPITGLVPNATYGFGITSTPFPGILALSVTVPQNAGGPTAVEETNVPQDASFNSAIPRMEPQPTGALSSTFGLLTGRPPTTKTFSTDFGVSFEGTVTLKVAFPAGATGVDVGLYQMGQQGDSLGDPPYTSAAVLRDFTTTLASGVYTITDFVPAGTYYLFGICTLSGSGSVTVTGNLPAVPAKVLNVEPTTGTIFAPEDSIINEGKSEFPSNGVNDTTFEDYGYSTSFFSVTVPSNTTGQPISATLFDNDGNSDTTSVGFGKASLTIWRFSGGVYTLVGSNASALDDSGTNSSNAEVFATDTPVSGAQYFIGVDLNAFATAVYVKVKIPVIPSGTPDFSVAPIQLLPILGQTLVQDNISNASYTASPQASYTLQLGNTTVTRIIPALCAIRQLSRVGSLQSHLGQRHVRGRCQSDRRSRGIEFNEQFAERGTLIGRSVEAHRADRVGGCRHDRRRRRQPWRRHRRNLGPLYLWRQRPDRDDQRQWRRSGRRSSSRSMQPGRRSVENQPSSCSSMRRPFRPRWISARSGPTPATTSSPTTPSMSSGFEAGRMARISM